MGTLLATTAGAAVVVLAACAECSETLSAVTTPTANAPATAIAIALRLNVLACIDLLLKL
jgi:hypothetical protein